MRLLALLGIPLPVAACLASDGFTAQQAQSATKYWAHAKRLASEPARRGGEEWVAQITPAGSLYLHSLYKLYGPGKVVPSREPEPPTPELALWQGWAHRKYDHDRAQAAEAAWARNRGKEPPAPKPYWEPAPAGLAVALGQAPVFVECVRPMRHTVTFHDGVAVTLEDHVRVRERYPYYRSHQGVVFAGDKESGPASAKIAKLAPAAGMAAKELKVFQAVSLLEGGFDSVNTYDSGVVSAGFIQFACLGEGAGSLGRALARYRDRDKAGFAKHFADLGVSVAASGRLACVVPGNGDVLEGAEAARAVAADVRLAAVFVRAGRASDGWLAAQLATAKAEYYPADDRVVVMLGNAPTEVRVGDVVRTEAGLATLTERKVNTGKLLGFAEHVARIAAAYGITDRLDLPAIELPVVRAMTYRKDFLLAPGLEKPRPVDVQAYRKGRRKG
jgi:hypothetical protein